MARFKALSLNVGGPLATIIYLGESGALTAEKVIAAAKLAVKFAGNALVQISRERHKRAILDMNPKLSDVGEKDTVYKDAAPELVGDKFAKEAKEREEQLHYLDRASGRGKGHPFHRGRPCCGGGNQSFYFGKGHSMPRGDSNPTTNQDIREKNFYLKGSGATQ